MNIARKRKTPAPLTDGAWPHYFQGMCPSTLETFEALTWLRAKQYLHGFVNDLRLARAVPSARAESLQNAHYHLGVMDGQIAVLYDLGGRRHTLCLVNALNRARSILRHEVEE